MRKIFVFCFLFLQSIVLRAQEGSYATILVHDNMFVQLVFESPIVSYKVGTADAIDVVQANNSITLQSIRMEDDTNLTVQTADNFYYAFILKHTTETPKLFYEIKKTDALNYTKVILAENASRKERKEAKELEERQNKKSFLEVVLSQRGYLKSYNRVEYKRISFECLGVYVNEEKMYLLFKVKNRSNINYELNRLVFMSSSRENKKKQLKSEEVEYTYSFIRPDFKNVSPKSEQRFVVVFEKFTLNDNKDFLCMLSELNGERALELSIPNEVISDARRLNY